MSRRREKNLTLSNYISFRTDGNNWSLVARYLLSQQNHLRSSEGWTKLGTLQCNLTFKKCYFVAVFGERTFDTFLVSKRKTQLKWRSKKMGMRLIIFNFFRKFLKSSLSDNYTMSISSRVVITSAIFLCCRRRRRARSHAAIIGCLHLPLIPCCPPTSSSNDPPLTCSRI